jgi:integrase
MAVRIVKRRGERRLVIDIVYRNPDGSLARYRHDADVQTLAAARAEERRRLALLATAGSPTGAPVAQGPALAKAKAPVPTFETVSNEYLGSYATSTFKPSTRRGYKALINGFLKPRVGAVAIDQIDGARVRDLDAELVTRGVKPATRRQMQSVLRSVLCRFAVERGLLVEAPRFPRLPKTGAKIPNVLTREQVAAILRAAHQRHRLTFLLAAYAGLRAGEIRALRWRDVDLKLGRLVVRESRCHGEVATPKSGHERVVPLVPELRKVFAAVKVREPDGLVASNARQKPWSQDGLRQAFQRACGRAETGIWRFHDLRHYFVTELFRAGVAAPTVQALAGHAHLTTTQRYAHVVQKDLAAAIERLAAEPPW